MKPIFYTILVSVTLTPYILFWLGPIGSGICFILVGPGFWVGLREMLKALIRPVLLVFEAFRFYYK